MLTPMPAVARLRLTDFRCYAALRLEIAPAADAGPVVLFGPNGAGKTNLLEALSFLSPGRGLRRARLADVGRHGAEGGWAVSARLLTADGETDVGTGLERREGANGSPVERRAVRIDGANASGPAALADLLGVQWLTPQMDRLFLEGAGARRRFLDRLVFGFDPEHIRRTVAYEKALRERARLLKAGGADPAWLSALEAQMSGHAIAIAAARRDAVDRIERALAHGIGPFPRATIRVSGGVEDGLADRPAVDVEAGFAEALRRGRPRDAETGGAAEGPHRSDLLVRHAEKDMAAADCSTGEQKALLIAVLLANARLESARRGSPPMLLLDEVAAHLDGDRRAALYEEILALGGQAWLTGTDRSLFDALAGRARFFEVRDAGVSDRGVG